MGSRVASAMAKQARPMEVQGARPRVERRLDSMASRGVTRCKNPAVATQGDVILIGSGARHAMVVPRLGAGDGCSCGKDEVKLKMEASVGVSSKGSSAGYVKRIGGRG